MAVIFVPLSLLLKKDVEPHLIMHGRFKFMTINPGNQRATNFSSSYNGWHRKRERRRDGWWRKGNGFEKIKSAPYCCWLVLSFLKLETRLVIYDHVLNENLF